MSSYYTSGVDSLTFLALVTPHSWEPDDHMLDIPPGWPGHVKTRGSLSPQSATSVKPRGHVSRQSGTSVKTRRSLSPQSGRSVKTHGSPSPQEASPGGRKRPPQGPRTERVMLLHIWCRFVDFSGFRNPPPLVGARRPHVKYPPWVARAREKTFVRFAPERNKDENHMGPFGPRAEQA